MANDVTEIERKRVLPDDGSAVKSLLTSLGYVGAGPSTEVDVYYTRPDVDYLATVECLRVRRRDGFAEITYKPASDARTHSAADVVVKRETNVVLSGPGQACGAERLLAAIGMRRLVRVEKVRALFRHPELPGVAVSIDTVPGVGTFIETEVNRTDPDGAVALIERIERQLGVADCPPVSLPYRDLVRQAMATG
ncbi:class IV adenylate cyclase [Streptomyces celluloflavus]|uniref:class IV adenylate cyclase n=1 Tax=Streptomyces celluloflavus TaxID=58344 RepID=UPI0036DA2971